jgi:hypothetical protein
MKPPRQNVGKAGTKGTKPLPNGAGMAVRPFPIHLFNAAFDAPHDLGEILTPKQMAAKVPPSASPEAIDRAARKALDALAGCGPVQPVPHVYTAEALTRGLAALRDFALAGDQDAMRSLGFVLSRAVADLGEMARRHPEIVREWSRKQNVVPVLTGKNIGHRKQLAADLDAVGVGEATPYRVNPPKGKKVPDISTPANALAGQLCKHLDQHRAIFPFLQRPVPEWARLASKLPPLSKAVWKKWAEAAWACLLDATDGHPEKCSALEPLGAKAARKAGLQTPRTRAANVRAEINETLGEAVCMVASAPPLRYSE